MLSIYREMLCDAGIMVEDVGGPVLAPIYNAPPVCRKCRSEPLTLWRSGFLTCHECGLVHQGESQWDHTCVPAYYNIEATKAMSGTHYERKRTYKPSTHFKEHLRRYMGARFTPIPDKLLMDLKEINVDYASKDAFLHVKKALKTLRYNTYYKEIFLIIYKLGGQPPVISDDLFRKCVRAYHALMLAFERKKDDWKRHSMPSNYVVMDMLLRSFGHQPYYRIPTLKDVDLQLKVQYMIRELEDFWKFSPQLTE